MSKENKYSQQVGGRHNKGYQRQVCGPLEKNGNNEKSPPEVSWESQMCLPEKKVGSHSNFSQGAGQAVV